MKEYTIIYIGHEDSHNMNMVASGVGNNETEAIENFKMFCDNLVEIVEVKFYKNCGRMFTA